MTEGTGLRILLTGGSSFTGCWFAEALVAAGHEVTVTLQSGSQDEYPGVRGRRVERIAKVCRCEYGTSFGDERFLRLVESERRWDVLCHHAAQVKDYKSADFDVSAAVASNTANLRQVLDALRGRDCDRLVVTGSVFEPGEGNGDGTASDELRAFSPYGLSKALTWEWLRFYAESAGFRVGKFVVSNPFGPYEEARFTDYLIRTWYTGQSASVRTPEYVRDNIHVSLLAKAYARFVGEWDDTPAIRRLAPMGYVERQGDFARRFAMQMRTRLSLACDVREEAQSSFPEPRVRFNRNPLNYEGLGWREDDAWEELAGYYRRLHGKASRTSIGP